MYLLEYLDIFLAPYVPYSHITLCSVVPFSDSLSQSVHKHSINSNLPSPILSSFTFPIKSPPPNQSQVLPFLKDTICKTSTSSVTLLASYHRRHTITSLLPMALSSIPSQSNPIRVVAYHVMSEVRWRNKISLRSTYPHTHIRTYSNPHCPLFSVSLVRRDFDF